MSWTTTDKMIETCKSGVNLSLKRFQNFAVGALQSPSNSKLRHFSFLQSVSHVDTMNSQHEHECENGATVKSLSPP